MNDLHAAIEALGVRVEYTNDLPAERLGCYLDDERLILIRASLHGALEAETLAHEYVHALHGDRSTDAACERRAWRKAAALLIDPRAFHAAATLSDDASWIARELGTTPRLVDVYRATLAEAGAARL